jgi:hypothetical protein
VANVPSRRQISVWLSIVGLDKIERLADDYDTDRSTVIRRLLTEALNNAGVMVAVERKLRDRA